MKKKLPAILGSLPIILIVAAGCYHRFHEAPGSAENPQTQQQASGTGHSGAGPLDAALPEEPAGTQELSRWIKTYRAAPVAEQSQLMRQGLEIAKRRMAIMTSLIRTDPEKALLESLSLSEWHHLPAELRPFVEEPVSSTADYKVYISCGTASSIDRITTLDDGRQFDTCITPGRRLEKTRKGIPVQGIKLGDTGALHPDIFQRLNDADHTVAGSLYPIANPDPTRCFFTGRPLSRSPVAALAGGRIYYFENTEALEQLENGLAELDGKSGPAPASALLTSALLSENPDDGFDLERAAQISAQQTADWSGSVRDMIVIMVDFSDIPGPPVDPALLENTINTTVSQQIYDMSFHQTYISGTVLTNTYRLPEPSSFYSSNHRPIHEHAVNVATTAGVDLSGYETVCVYFPYIADLSELAGYASLGGGELWLHNTVDPYVIIHELGHNYGSYHAHFWEVAGTDPVDPAGIHREYGDVTDIMGSGRPPKGHFHVQNKREVGWLGPDRIRAVTNSGTYRIHRADHPQTDPDTLCGLTCPIDPTNAYWVGYRQLYTEYESFGRGTYLLWQQANPSNYPKSHLLDMTPGTSQGILDAGLALGSTWSDTATPIHITPVQRGGNTPDEWIDVTINLGPFSSNRPPASSIIGPSDVSTRESAAFAVDASDPDGDDLAYSWDFGDGLVHANFQQAAHAWLLPGTGTVRCIVSDMKGGTVTNEQTVTVSETLQMVYQKNIFATDIYDMTTDGTKLVAVGKSGFSGISTNGTDWSYSNVGGIYTWVYLYSVVHDGVQFVAVGKDYDFDIGIWIGVIFTSPDGLSWTRRHAGGPVLNAVAYGKNTLIAAGENGTILRSSSGLSWSPGGSALSGTLKGITHTGYSFTVVGAATNGGSCVYFSVDGQNWHDRSANAGTGGWAFSTVANCNGLLLAGGPGIGIRHSIDGGESFTTATGEQLTIPAFAYGNGIYFAAGKYSFSTQADIDLISTDGVNWTALPTADQNDRTAAVFFDNSFFTIGLGGALWKSETVGIHDRGWALWQLHHASILGFNRDATDDPDGDGVLNLVEYALGTDAVDASSIPAIQPRIDELGYLQMDITRSRAAADLDYLVERSTNLLDTISWSSIETVTVTNLPTRLIIRSAYPVSAQDEEFLRLRVRMKSP